MVVAQTTISKIDGEKGQLIYRGYDATELARKLSFEQVAYLLWFGKLPNQAELDNFSLALKSNRPMSKEAKTFLNGSTASMSPLAVLRTGSFAIRNVRKRQRTIKRNGNKSCRKVSRDIE